MNMRSLHRGLSRALGQMNGATHPRMSVSGELESIPPAARGWRIPAMNSGILTDWQRRLLLKRGAQIYTTSVERADRCAIAILDARGIVISWHDRLPHASSYDYGVVSRHMSQFYLAGDVALHVPARHLSIATEQGVDTQVGWRRRPDGDVFWGVTIIQAIRLRDSEVLGYSHVTRSLREPAQYVSPPLRMTPFTANLAMTA